MVSERTRRLALAYLCGGFGLAMTAQIAFLVPLRARELGAGFDLIGVIMGVGALAAALTSIPCGAIIDRLGPKRSFVAGTAITAVVSVLFALTTNVWTLLLLQPIHGVARNLGWVASQAYITAAARDADERPRLTGRFSLFGNVGRMAGPLLVGGAASVVGFQWAMLVPATYALAFTALGIGLRETRRPGTDGGPRRAQGTGHRAAVHLMRLPGIQVALVLTSARLWISTVFATFLPLFLVERALDPAVAGIVVAASGLIAAAIAPTAGAWSRRFGPQWATVLGLGMGALALVVTPYLVTLPVVFVPPALIGVAIGLSLPLLISIVTTAAPDEQQGIALGLRGTVNQAAGTAAPIAVGPLMSALGLGLGFVAGGGIGFALLATAVILHRRPGTPDVGTAPTADADHSLSTEQEQRVHEVPDEPAAPGGHRTAGTTVASTDEPRP